MKCRHNCTFEIRFARSEVCRRNTNRENSWSECPRGWRVISEMSRHEKFEKLRGRPADTKAILHKGRDRRCAESSGPSGRSEFLGGHTGRGPERLLLSAQ